MLSEKAETAIQSPVTQLGVVYFGTKRRNIDAFPLHPARGSRRRPWRKNVTNREKEC